MFFKIKTKIRRFLSQLFNLDRPTSYPFITGDGFRSLAQHFFDGLSDFKTNMVEDGDIIFVRSDFLTNFFTKKHPLIKNKYVLISHNQDTNITKDYEKYLDEKIIHWFAQNVLFEHKKITPIPIGLTNYHYTKIMDRGKPSYIKEAIKSIPCNKKTKISFGFDTSSNPIRVMLKNNLEKNDLAEKIISKKQTNYYKKMSEYKFTISPEGNGFDCYRTWEACYLKTIPIVKESSMNNHFKKIGVPLLIVKEWDDISHFNEKFLYDMYEELSVNFKNPALYMKYWLNEILEKSK
jgi:hypothetical protein